jgi:hypothetical protein
MRLHRVLMVLFAALTANAAWAQIDVEGPQDSLAGAPTINHCTLRKAVLNANSNSAPYPQCRAGSGLDTIVFDNAFTITLTLTGANEDAGLTGDLDITDDLIIDGTLPSGITGMTIIDGNASDRVFHIHPGITVTIRNLWIRNGSGNDGGGGILVDGATLNLQNVTISGCSAPNEDGGAIKIINNGIVNITNCTITGNSTNFHAGAIANDGGTLTIKNSTITGNTGGFSNTTGGIRNTGTCSLRNTIVAGNSGTDIPNLDGAFTSNGFNIIGELGTLTPGNPQITATTGDQFDVNVSDIHLGPLQDNGGPAPTEALQGGSIAIDQGNSSGSTTDERGQTRPCDNASITNVTGGDGADVGAYEAQPCSNTPPHAVDDSATVNEGSGANTINVLSNDTDTDGDTLTITAVTQGAHGAVVNNSTSVSYTPAHNFFGSDSFTYTISDGHSSDTATVTVTVININDAPVANGDSYSMNQDTTFSPAAPGVLGNDTDVDGDVLTAVLVGNVAHGSLTLNGNGSFTYTPAPHFAGNDAFTYKATDGPESSNVATAALHVIDTEPPTITAAVAKSSLWPVNHDLANVGLTFSAVDNSTAVTTSVAIYSDEDDVTSAGGDQSPDAANIAAGTLRLRAERKANGDGRVYLILLTAADAFSNTSHRCLTVVVPKSQSPADAAAVNAQASAARAQCTATGMAPAGYFLVGDGPVIGPKQ